MLLPLAAGQHARIETSSKSFLFHTLSLREKALLDVPFGNCKMSANLSIPHLSAQVPASSVSGQAIETHPVPGREELQSVGPLFAGPTCGVLNAAQDAPADDSADRELVVDGQTSRPRRDHEATICDPDTMPSVLKCCYDPSNLLVVGAGDFAQVGGQARREALGVAACTDRDPTPAPDLIKDLDGPLRSQVGQRCGLLLEPGKASLMGSCESRCGKLLWHLKSQLLNPCDSQWPFVALFQHGFTSQKVRC